MTYFAVSRSDMYYGHGSTLEEAHKAYRRFAIELGDTDPPVPEFYKADKPLNVICEQVLKEIE